MGQLLASPLPPRLRSPRYEQPFRRRMTSSRAGIVILRNEESNHLSCIARALAQRVKCVDPSRMTLPRAVPWASILVLAQKRRYRQCLTSARFAP
jgi:hypothetical protein